MDLDDAGRGRAGPRDAVPQRRPRSLHAPVHAPDVVRRRARRRRPRRLHLRRHDRRARVHRQVG